mgnify:FL=1
MFLGWGSCNSHDLSEFRVKSHEVPFLYVSNYNHVAVVVGITHIIESLVHGFDRPERNLVERDVLDKPIGYQREHIVGSCVALMVSNVPILTRHLKLVLTLTRRIVAKNSIAVQLPAANTRLTSVRHLLSTLMRWLKSRSASIREFRMTA